MLYKSIPDKSTNNRRSSLEINIGNHLSANDNEENMYTSQQTIDQLYSPASDNSQFSD